MNVIQKFFDLLPAHWQQKVKDNNWFTLSQFNHSVMVRFDDGSFCFYKYAFVLEDKEHKELAVFTEHCGYYVFSTRGIWWEVMKVEHAVDNINNA